MGLAFNLVQRGVDWLVLASLAIRLPTTVWKRFPPPDPIQIEGGGDHAAGVLEGIRNGAHATEGSYLLVEMALQTVACSQMTNPIPFLRRPLPLLSLSAAPVQTPSTLDPHPLTTPSQKKYICMEFQGKCSPLRHFFPPFTAHPRVHEHELVVDRIKRRRPLFYVIIIVTAFC